MKHLLILLLLIPLLCGCANTAGEGAAKPARTALLDRIKSTAVPSPTPLDPAQKTLDVCVGSDVVSFRLSDMGVVVGTAGALTVDPALFSAFYNKLNDRFGTPAQDAQVVYSEDPAEPIAIVPETPGQRIDEAALRLALTKPDAVRILVDLQPIEADVTATELKERYSLLSEFTTSFKGSTLGRKNRVNNMALAVERINGVVLAPGEEFSMNETILDRNKENGYYLAPAIRNGTYEKEYGGGVCQVSSTLFNAVMMADLTVTERHHHSWPMTYVPIGRDATISTGYKDFKFVNDSEGELVIFAHMDRKAKTITVRLYGVHSHNFDHIKIVSERTGSLPAKGTKVLLDESLSAGSRVEERKERRGKTSVTYKEYYDADGKLLHREKAFEDSYPSIEGLVYVAANLYR